MQFGLFVALNALLLLRPEELFPEIEGLRLYLIVICLCTASSHSELLETLSLDSLRVRPISVCVLLYFASTLVSLCVLGRVSEALLEFGPEFAKVILYYFLLISIINTPARFRNYIISLLLLILVLTAIALAQHYGLTAFPNIQPAMQREFDPVTGEAFWIPRLCSSGIFSDPNDLCLILCFGILSCIFLAMTGPSQTFIRVTWLAPIPVFIFAMMETHSRGGVLGILAGVGCYFVARYGGPKALPASIGGGFAALALIGGRQGNISGGGTAHERLMMWADGISNLLNQPLYIPTGLGLNWFTGEYTLLAHNSFVQAYVEQGLFGGGAFLGAFAFSAWICMRMGKSIRASAWALEVRPFTFAIVCGFGMGCYSLSRNTVLPTYMVLGIAAAVVESNSVLLPAQFLVTSKWFSRCILLSIGGLVFLKFATQLLGMAGV